MANQTSASYGNGISGATTGISGGNTAIRKSVAKTQKGYGSAVAALRSILRPRTCVFAYHPVEADAPAIDRT